MMTLGQLRESTKHLPDDTQVLGDHGDLEMHDLQIGMILPPVLDHPFVVTLRLGQVWNEELDIDARIDARHME